MAEYVGRGSLTRRWKTSPCQNIRGGITIERGLPAETKLWLSGWTKTIAGGELVSVLVEIADEGGRPFSVIRLSSTEQLKQCRTRVEMRKMHYCCS
jgi:hypothetical protein